MALRLFGETHVRESDTEWLFGEFTSANDDLTSHVVTSNSNSESLSAGPEPARSLARSLSHGVGVTARRCVTQAVTAPFTAPAPARRCTATVTSLSG